MPALHGFIVECRLSTPTIGLSQSPSLKLTARSMARLGAPASPSVMTCERLLSFSFTFSSFGQASGLGGVEIACLILRAETGGRPGGRPSLRLIAFHLRPNLCASAI